MATLIAISGERETVVSKTPEFTISRADLLRELQVVQHAVERKIIVPILTHFLFTADEGGALFIQGTDLDHHVRVMTESVKVKQAGAICIPARKLYDYVKLLKDGDVTIKALDNGWVQIKSGRSHTKMVALAATLFPVAPFSEAPASTTLIPSRTLLEAIKRVAGSMSEDDGARFSLQGALVFAAGDKLSAVSTDGHRLSLSEHPLEGVEMDKTFIAGRALGELAVLLQATDAESVEFAASANNLFFTVGSRILSARKAAVRFPNYEAVLPRVQGDGILLDVPSLLLALRRVLTFADPRTMAVKLTLSTETLRLEARSADIGETDEELAILGGPEQPTVIGFNGEYMRDMLQLLDGSVACHLKDSLTAGLFIKPYDDGSLYQHVIMPMRVEAK